MNLCFLCFLQFSKLIISNLTFFIFQNVAAAAKSLQLCPTRCDPHRRQPTRLPRPRDSPGKNTGVGCHLLLQCMKVKSLSHVRLLVTPLTAAYQAPPSMGFSRQEYWSGLPLPSPQNVALYLKFVVSPDGAGSPGFTLISSELVVEWQEMLSQHL